MPAAWSLDSGNRPQIRAIQANSAVECRGRQLTGSRKAQAVDRTRIVDVSEDLVPVAGLEHANSVGAGKADRDVTPVRRPDQPVDHLRQPADPADQLARPGLEHIKAVRLLPFEAGPAPGHDETPVRRDGDGKELAFLAGTDRRAQHPQWLATRERPQAHGL